MKTTTKCYVVDFYLDGYYLKSQSLFQDDKIEVGAIIDIEIPDKDANVTGQVVETFDMSDDEYHLYINSL